MTKTELKTLMQSGPPCWAPKTNVGQHSLLKANAEKRTTSTASGPTSKNDQAVLFALTVNMSTPRTLFRATFFRACRLNEAQFTQGAQATRVEDWVGLLGLPLRVLDDVARNLSGFR